MNSKLVLFVAMVVVSLIALTAFVSADSQWTEPNTPDVKEMRVYVNDAALWYGYCEPDFANPPTWICTTTQYEVPSFERGENLDVKVAFIPTTSISEVTVRTWLTGYKEDIEDESNPFDVFANYTYIKTLNLEIPADAEATEEYTLRVEIESQVQLTGVARANIDTQIQEKSNDLVLKYVSLYANQNECSCSVEQVSKGQCGECNVAFEAGSNVCADVTVRNKGSQEAEDVFAVLEVKDMCIEKTAYFGDLDADGGDDDSATETICFTIPKDTKAGSYTLKISAGNEDSGQYVETTTFNVKAAEIEPVTPVEEAKAEIMLQQTSATVEQGKGAVYSLFVANLGTDQTFIVSVEGADGWATTQVNPQVFTLANGESKSVNVYLAANEDAVASDHVFTVKVKYGDTVKVYNLNAKVTEKPSIFGGWDLKTVLMVVAIALAVIIVILLIVLLAKKGGKDKAEETYY